MSILYVPRWGIPYAADSLLPCRKLSPRIFYLEQALHALLYVILEHFQFEMRSISNHTVCVSRKKRGFSAKRKPIGAVPPYILPFFKDKMLYKHCAATIECCRPFGHMFLETC